MGNGLKVSEYEVYWPTDFLLINNYAWTKKDFCNYFETLCSAYEKKQTNQNKEKSVVL